MEKEIIELALKNEYNEALLDIVDQVKNRDTVSKAELYEIILTLIK